ncbi:MAG: hypothetical protein AABX29_00595 [Nanoarchaeota archaeon]
MIKQASKAVFYFGYGQNSSREMMAAITQRSMNDIVSWEAVLEGYELCVQDFAHVPPRSQELLRKSWGDIADSLRFYVIRPKEGGIVKGRVSLLTEQGYDLVKNQELIAFGWRGEVDGEVLTPGNRDKIAVKTEVLGVDQKITSVVDEENYSPFLNHKETTLRVAKETSDYYLELLRNKEGTGAGNPTESKN